MKYLLFAIWLGGVLLYVLAFIPSGRGRAIGAVVGGGVMFLVVVGLLPLGIGLRGIWRGLASTRWPTMPGVVLKGRASESHTAAQRSGNSYTFYSADLVFGYQVKGRDYTTEQVQFGRARATGDASDATVLLLRYPVGAKVPVFYNPSDPSVAVVRTGVHAEVVWFLVAGLAYRSLATDVHRVFSAMSLLWLIFALLGVAMLTPGLHNLWRARASESWPVTSGVIVYAAKAAGSRVSGDSAGSTVQSPAHGAPLAYRYEVKGENYFSHVRHFVQFASGWITGSIVARSGSAGQ